MNFMLLEKVMDSALAQNIDKLPTIIVKLIAFFIVCFLLGKLIWFAYKLLSGESVSPVRSPPKHSRKDEAEELEYDQELHSTEEDLEKIKSYKKEKKRKQNILLIGISTGILFIVLTLLFVLLGANA